MENIGWDAFLAFLQERLKQKLPGLPAQLRMAPKGRKSSLPSNYALQSAKKAGVLILLYPKDGLPHLVLMKRVTYPGVHSGQISFPGGKLEAADKDLKDAAFRETWEEIGVAENSLQYLGALSPSYIPPSKFYVETYLAASSAVPNFKKDDREVDHIIEVPLNLLQKPETVKSKVMKGSSGWQIEAPYFQVFEHEVWGATAMMLAELLALLEEG